MASQHEVRVLGPDGEAVHAPYYCSDFSKLGKGWEESGEGNELQVHYLEMCNVRMTGIAKRLSYGMLYSHINKG